MSTIVVTGASGFVGRQLVAYLAARGDRVVAIARRPKPSDLPGGVTWLSADLLEPASYESALTDATCVLHLAAITGKARPEAYQRGNVDATAALLAAAERAGVQRFVLVSSIAAVFPDRRYYPYAESKIAAEKLVQASRLRTTIVRPTMILGDGSPIQHSLESLARLPFIPMFGDGERRVQPVDVADVVKLLAAIASDPDDVSAVVELGGPEVYSLKELLTRLRVLQGRQGQSPRFLHLPLALMRWFLALLERPLFSVLPLTAGQLASFANNSVATRHPLAERLLRERNTTPTRSARVAAVSPVATP
ncbi:MAG: NAD-dependent epimerase/dehydratase family protein [Polyangiales bacterium]